MNREEYSILIEQIEDVYSYPDDIWLNWPLRLRYTVPPKLNKLSKNRDLGIALVVIGTFLVTNAVSASGSRK